MAPGPHGPLTLRCRVVSAPQQYGWGNRFLVSEPDPASFRYRDRPRPRSFYAIDPKSMDQGHWPYPPPWRGRKRHRVLCGRLSKSGWEWGGQLGKAASFSDSPQRVSPLWVWRRCPRGSEASAPPFFLEGATEYPWLSGRPMDYIGILPGLPTRSARGRLEVANAFKTQERVTGVA